MSALSYTGSLKLIPGDSGHKADDTLDGYNHTHTHTHPFTHYGQFRVANQPTTHACGLWRKPEYLEKTPETRREQESSTHTGRRRDSEPPTPEVRGTRANH